MYFIDFSLYFLCMIITIKTVNNFYKFFYSIRNNKKIIVDKNEGKSFITTYPIIRTVLIYYIAIPIIKIVYFMLAKSVHFLYTICNVEIPDISMFFIDILQNNDNNDSEETEFIINAKIENEIINNELPNNSLDEIDTLEEYITDFTDVREKDKEKDKDKDKDKEKKKEETYIEQFDNQELEKELLNEEHLDVTDIAFSDINNSVQNNDKKIIKIGKRK